MKPIRRLPRTLLFASLGLALGACSDSNGTSATATTERRVADARIAAPSASPVNEKDLVAEIANSLQACSYDGSPLALRAGGLDFHSRGSGAQVVAEIMKFTGLPQNFEVIEGQVPNAAAVIVLGPDKLPKRVIAYNRRFMEQVREATHNNNWAPISIMAHEIGHHLSGHTITPGGSQPPTELEADKFSGFVLYKMGSSLADAQKALETLVPEQDGKTHPGRRKRVAAIRDGWQQACTQQTDDCRSGSAITTTAAAAKSEPTAPRRVAQAPASATAAASGTDALAADVAMNTPAVSADTTAADRTVASVNNASTDAPARGTAADPVRTLPSGVDEASTDVASAPASSRRADTLPLPDANAIPAKFDRFIYDEVGLLDPTTRRAFEQQMFTYAQQHNVEIVSILVKDLHGLTADEYAYAMMRQLRVGKLDVGNGTVLVAAPNEKQVGVAMGPGVQREMKSSVALEKLRLNNFLAYGYSQCQKHGACNAAWTESFLGAAAHIANDTEFLPWTIRYQSLDEVLTVDARERAATDRRYDPNNDPIRGQISHIVGTLVERDARGGELARYVSDKSASADADVQRMQVTTAQGWKLLLSVDPHTEKLMPTVLTAGKRYDLVVRLRSAGFHNPKDPILVDLLSYSTLD